MNDKCGSEVKHIYCSWWRSHWWKAQGNIIKWTNHRIHRLKFPSDDDFVHCNILSWTYDSCEGLMQFNDVLLWVGKSKVIEIDIDYCFALKEFIPIFRYKCERQMLDVIGHEFGLSIA